MDVDAHEKMIWAMLVGTLKGQERSWFGAWAMGFRV